MNTDGNVTSATLMSLSKMWNAFPADFESRLILADGGCADLAGSRNRLVRVFLSTPLDWLLIVDADVIWEPADWERLRDSANEDYPFVAGTYFVVNDPIRPCAMTFKEGASYTPVLRDDSPELVQVSAACVGFGLIHRDVFLKSGDMANDHEWFEHGCRAPNGQTLPEDWAFCSRVGEAGFPIYLNTKVRLGHLKPRIYGWDDYVGTTSGQE